MIRIILFALAAALVNTSADARWRVEGAPLRCRAVSDVARLHYIQFRDGVSDMQLSSEGFTSHRGAQEVELVFDNRHRVPLTMIFYSGVAEGEASLRPTNRIFNLITDSRIMHVEKDGSILARFDLAGSAEAWRRFRQCMDWITGRNERERQF